MEYLWRLATAIFLLMLGAVCGLLIVLFQETVIAGICVYALLVLIPWGMIKGIVAIWAYHKNQKQE